MPKYDHAFSLGFSLRSEEEDGSDVTEAMLLAALKKRIAELTSPDYAEGLEEACGCPWDTYALDD